MLLGQRPFKICSLKQDLVVIKLHPIGQTMSSPPKKRYMWARCQVPSHKRWIHARPWLPGMQQDIETASAQH